MLNAESILGDKGVISESLPGYEHRPTQIELAEAIESAIADRAVLVAEAGTGTGKSLAYLTPALLSGRQTIVSTAGKALQDQLWNKDIPDLAQWLPNHFDAVRLKGRSNYLCLDRWHEPKQGTLERKDLSGVHTALEAWLGETEDGDLDTFTYPVPEDMWAVRQDVTISATECHGNACTFYSQCFAQRARERAKTADLIVVNHHLLLTSIALAAQTGGMVELLPQAETIVLDECHHLADVASNVFGAECSERRWQATTRRINKMLEHDSTETAKAVHEALGQATAEYDYVFASLHSQFQDSPKGPHAIGNQYVLFTAIEQAFGALVRTMRQHVPATFSDEDRKKWAKRVEAVTAVHDDLQTILCPPRDEDDMVRVVDISGEFPHRYLTLKARPVNVTPILRQAIFNKEKHEEGKDPVPVTVVAVSATAAIGDDFDHWCEEVGADDARTLVVSSPFDYPHNALTYLPEEPALLTPPKFGDERAAECYFDEMAEEMERLVLASNGRAFLLFTSYRALKAVHDRLFSRLPNYRLYRQGDLPPRELIERFRKNNPAVLFATRSFWEGVDIPGDALSLVVIDKLPFAPPGDPVWDAKVERYKRQGRDWFRELALPHCVTTLKQGFGRLIRTKTDHGVVAILDGRMVTARYGGQVLRSLPPAKRTRSLDDVRSFFAA